MTIITPENHEVSFRTRGQFLTAKFPATAGRIILAGGLPYVCTVGGPFTDALGQTWAPQGLPDVRHFGALADGVTDDSFAIQQWFDYIKDQNPTTGGYQDPVSLYDLRGGIFAVGQPLILNGSNSAALHSGTFIATGSGWSSADYLLTNNVAYSDFTSLKFYCSDVCNGVRDNAGRTNWDKQRIYRFTQVGWHKPASSGPDSELMNSTISQFRTTDPEFADQNNFTGVGICIQQSDCKVSNTSVLWCKTCYLGTGGQQDIFNCHFVQGTGGAYARSNSVLIEFNPWYHGHGVFDDGTENGELTVANTYLDNGEVHVYTDKINILNCGVLLDTADVQVDTFFNFYAPPHVGDFPSPGSSGDFVFKQWDEDAELFGWEEGVFTLPSVAGTYTWGNTAAFDKVTARTKELLAGGKHNTARVHLNTRAIAISTNFGGVAEEFVSTDVNAVRAYYDANTTGARPRVGGQGNDVVLKASDGNVVVAAAAMEYKEQSVEPFAPNGSVALAAAGVVVTNGFGSAGPGFYKKLLGSWTAF